MLLKHTIGKEGLAEVYHYDSYGAREAKYQQLSEWGIKEPNFQKLKYKAPYFFFTPKDFRTEESYEEMVL